jgi:small GTP-binding protein
MDFSLKVVILGAEGVGKSCLLGLLANEPFEYSYYPTIGADLRMIKYEGIKMCIWDLSGSEKFSNIRDSLVKSANVLVFCHDSTSFNKTMQYYNQYKNLSAKKIFVETKSDLHNTQFNINTVKTSSLKRNGREDLIRSIISSYIVPEEESYVQKVYIERKYKKYCCIC